MMIGKVKSKNNDSKKDSNKSSELNTEAKIKNNVKEDIKPKGIIEYTKNIKLSVNAKVLEFNKMQKIKSLERKERKEENTIKREKLRALNKGKIDTMNLFYRIMFENGIYNKEFKTFELVIDKCTEYGYEGKLKQVPGITFDEFEDVIGKVQGGLACIFILKKVLFDTVANITIIKKGIDADLEFTPPKELQPYEMALSVDLTNKEIINNCNDNCMFLFGGATGSGKTRFIYSILLSWIMKCKPEEIGLYIGDIAKQEYVNFQDVAHVKGYAEELEELYAIMMYFFDEIKRRRTILKELRKSKKGTNIKEYNAINKVKMEYSYILIDEFSVIIPDDTDTNKEKYMKNRILSVMKTISKMGRSLGIFIILCTQKTSKDEMPPILKNMSAVRLSFRANDEISSQVILGDNSACGIPPRYFIYSFNGGSEKSYGFAKKLEIEQMNNILDRYVNYATKRVDYMKKYYDTDEYLNPSPKEEDNKKFDIKHKDIKERNYDKEEDIIINELKKIEKEYVKSEELEIGDKKDKLVLDDNFLDF